MLRCLIVLCLLVLGQAGFTQEVAKDVNVSGRVTDAEGNAMEACIISALQPADSSIIAYCMTGSDGGYLLTFKTEPPEVLLRITGFNVKKKTERIEAKDQTIDLVAEEENLVLREVQVKAMKLWGSRDTLNYLVSAYMKDHDRTIGDVLQQLPGITIEPNGTIKYQGVAINHFYIENMDVLQGRYNLATQGIRAEDVATVQVLENHEHVKALQDQVPPESAAINLKLKDKAKGVWTKSISMGIGYDDETFWSGRVYITNFGKRRQHFYTYDTNNTGHGADDGEYIYRRDGVSANVMTEILTPGTSSVGNTLRNNKQALSLNNLNKLNETDELHYNIYYKHDIQRHSSFAQTTYILPDAQTRNM